MTYYYIYTHKEGKTYRFDTINKHISKKNVTLKLYKIC